MRVCRYCKLRIENYKLQIYGGSPLFAYRRDLLRRAGGSVQRRLNETALQLSSKKRRLRTICNLEFSIFNQESRTERGLSSPQQSWNVQRLRKARQRPFLHVAADWKVRAPFLNPTCLAVAIIAERLAHPVSLSQTDCLDMVRSKHFSSRLHRVGRTG